jgi:integrase
MSKQPKPITLLRYFEDVFLPTKLANGSLQSKSGKFYRGAVFAFLAFVEREIGLHEIDSELCNQFLAWRITNGYARHTSRNYAYAIKAIARHKFPDAFPTDGKGSGQPNVSFADADIEGTLDQIFKDCYLPERTSISSPMTIRQYGRCLHLFSVFVGRPCEPADLTDRKVGKFLRWLVEVEGVKPVTANGYVKQLKALWTWLAKKRVVDLFPTVDKLKEPERIAIAWTREELRKFLAACGEQVGFMGGVLSNLWWVAFHRVLWDSGERTGAMLALKWDWLDFQSGHLTVPGEFRKGRQKSMVYRLKPSTVESLRQIRRPDREVIFALDEGKPDLFYRRYRQILKDADLPYEPHRSGPQKWRRSFASHIEAAGGNATRALKHRDRRVTEDSYLDPKITEVDPENEKLFPLDGDES